MVCATSNGLDQPALMHSLIRAFASQILYDSTIRPLTKHHLESISLKGGCTDWSESTLVNIPPCWKSHVAAQSCFLKKKFSLQTTLRLIFL